MYHFLDCQWCNLPSWMDRTEKEEIGVGLLGRGSAWLRCSLITIPFQVVSSSSWFFWFFFFWIIWSLHYFYCYYLSSAFYGVMYGSGTSIMILWKDGTKEFERVGSWFLFLLAPYCLYLFIYFVASLRHYTTLMRFPPLMLTTRLRQGRWFFMSLTPYVLQEKL